jgi:hypothetical protein
MKERPAKQVHDKVSHSQPCGVEGRVSSLDTRYGSLVASMWGGYHWTRMGAHSPGGLQNPKVGNVRLGMGEGSTMQRRRGSNEWA